MENTSNKNSRKDHLPGNQLGGTISSPDNSEAEHSKKIHQP